MDGCSMSLVLTLLAIAILISGVIFPDPDADALQSLAAAAWEETRWRLLRPK